MWILEEVIHTFRENDRVSVVAGSSNYRGKHSGRTGTVKYVYDNNSSGNIAVALDGISNQASSRGWFYFKENELMVSCEVAGGTYFGAATCGPGVVFPPEIEAVVSKTKINMNGDNENMKSEKILKLWHSAGMKSIGSKMAEKEEALLADDSTCMQLRSYMTEIDRIISKSRNYDGDFSNNFNYEQFASDETMQKITEARNEMTDKKKDLSHRLEEIAAMLSACDTYEQEMNVLRTYDVIDEDGRLNKIFAL